jgi:hypothetical protein
MSLCEIRTKCGPTNVFFQNSGTTFSTEKGTPKFGLLLCFSQNIPNTTIAQQAKIRSIWLPWSQTGLDFKQYIPNVRNT